MEPNTLQPNPIRTQYQSPTITQLGDLEQVTRNVVAGGTGDTLYLVTLHDGTVVDILAS